MLCAPAGGAAYTPTESISAAEGTVGQGFYYVLGNESPDQFHQELQQWMDQVAAGAANVAAEAERFNADLPSAVGRIVDEHVAKGCPSP